MDEQFKVYVDRLKDDKPESWDLEVSPDFLSFSEKEMSFDSPVYVHGMAQVTDDELLVQLQLATKVTMPCSICNQKFEYQFQAEPVVHCVPVKEVKGAVFDWGPIAREAILLDLPHFAKCGGEHCHNQGEMERYMKAGQAGDASDKDGNYQPFANLEL